MNEAQARLAQLLTEAQDHIELHGFPRLIDEPISDVRPVTAEELQELVSDLIEADASGQEVFSDLEDSEESIDVLAWYTSFRGRVTNLEEWGITFDAYRFASFVKRTATRASIPVNNAFDVCYKFVDTHEVNHYEIDLAAYALENLTGLAFPTPHVVNGMSCEDEESLGQARAFAATKKMDGAAEIRLAYEHAGLHAYSDFVRWEGKIERGFEEVLRHRIAGSCTSTTFSSGLGALLMKPRGLLRPNAVPRYVDYQSSRPSSSSIFEFSVVGSITRSARVDKLFRDLSKGDQIRLKQIDRALARFKDDPNHPSLKTRPYRGSKSQVIINVNPGDRLILDREGHDYQILDFGNDLYDH